MNSLYSYLWVLLAYCALYLTVKYLFNWFMKDSDTGISTGKTNNHPAPETDLFANS